MFRFNINYAQIYCIFALLNVIGKGGEKYPDPIEHGVVTIRLPE